MGAICDEGWTDANSKIICKSFYGNNFYAWFAGQNCTGFTIGYLDSF